MVKVSILIEGAPLQHPNVAAATMNNAASFREAFRKLFQSGISNPDVSIQVQNAAGYRNAVKMFLAADNQLLLIDLDGRPDTRQAKLEGFAADPHFQGFNIETHSSSIFFMVQKMEAWMLSQPDKIEQLLTPNMVTSGPIANSEHLLNLHPAEIIHPDRALHFILMEHFEENRNGRIVRMKYHGKKLTLAPRVIEILDITLLRATFQDVEALLQKIDSSSSNLSN